jgi:hypothetical protein
MSRKLRTHPHGQDGSYRVFHIPASPEEPMQYLEVRNNLEALKKLVGGWIEIVRTDHIPELRCGCRMVMVVNENGIAEGLMPNTRVMQYYPWNIIRGDVFLIGEGPVKDSDGFEDVDLFSLPPEFHNWEGPEHGYPSQFDIAESAEV